MFNGGGLVSLAVGGASTATCGRTTPSFRLTPKSFLPKRHFKQALLSGLEWGRKVVLPTIRYKLLEAFGLARDI